MARTAGVINAVQAQRPPSFSEQLLDTTLGVWQSSAKQLLRQASEFQAAHKPQRQVVNPSGMGSASVQAIRQILRGQRIIEALGVRSTDHSGRPDGLRPKDFMVCWEPRVSDGEPTG